MKRAIACGLCTLMLGVARAEDTSSAVTPEAAPGGRPIKAPALQVKPENRGYAADQPEIFIRQRLFGRAHGLSLLTAACLQVPAYSKAVEETYTAWYAKQAAAIETIVRDLARYYFGLRADEAQWFDLVYALNLPDSIEPAMGEVTLHAACASLPEAIPRPRYALDKLLAGIGDADALPDDVAAVTSPQSATTAARSAPAPGAQKPGE